MKMETVCDFFVSGSPKAQPRPRMTKGGHVYTPDSAMDWKEAVSVACRLRVKETITRPVRLAVYFCFPMPKRIKAGGGVSPHVSKPDADNLLKAVMDAMTWANVWTDDALVFSSVTEKWYHEGPSGARIKVEVVK